MRRVGWQPGRKKPARSAGQPRVSAAADPIPPSAARPTKLLRLVEWLRHDNITLAVRFGNGISVASRVIVEAPPDTSRLPARCASSN